jgi:SNF2 family DNA or RNA helicase
MPQTLQTIGLILSNPPMGYSEYPISKLSTATSKSPTPRTTLIVCPVTVMANWDIQIRKYVNVGLGKPVVVLDRYHGPRRKMVLERLLNNELDVVLTSYHTLSADFKLVYKIESKKGESKGQAKSKVKEVIPEEKVSNIFRYKFYRVVLDEGEFVCAFAFLFMLLLKLSHIFVIHSRAFNKYTLCCFMQYFRHVSQLCSHLRV